MTDKKKKPESAKIPAVIYARFSSSGQREESITGQIRECSSWAERHGFEIVNTYEDRAKTGTNDNRPAFQQMIKDSKKKKFQAVIVWKMDRFARSRYDSAIYKSKLSKNNVKVFSAMEPITDGPESVIIEGLLESMAEFYSKNLSQNVKRGNYESAIQHKTVGVRLLGYRPSASDHFEIDPETAPIVQRIFREYTSGKSTRKICDSLNADGIRTRTGGRWNKNSLVHILKNERYTGTYIFGDLVRDPGGMPALIDQETFDTAQRILESRKHSPAASRSVRYLLTGKIYCAECGEPLIGESARSASGEKYFYYVCRNRKIKKCDLPRINKTAVEARVVQNMADSIMDDNFIEQLADLAHRQSLADRDRSEIEMMEADLRDVESRIVNLERVLETGVVLRSVSDRLADLEEQQAQLQKAIRKMEAEEQPIRKEEIIYFLEKMRGDPSDPEFQDRLTRIFLNSVYVQKNDRIRITVNFLDENSEPVGLDCSSLPSMAGPFIRKTNKGKIFAVWYI